MLQNMPHDALDRHDPLVAELIRVFDPIFISEDRDAAAKALQSLH